MIDLKLTAPDQDGFSMRVLVFENIVDSGLGGQERSLYEICEGLAAQGTEISLVYRQAGNLLPKYRRFIREEIRVAQYVIKPRSLGRTLVDLLRLVTAARQQRWQVLYTSQYFDTAFAGLLSHILGIPLVCHLRLPAPPYLSRQYRWGLKQCARLVAISQDTKQSYVRMGVPESIITVIYNAIDTEIFTLPKISEDRNQRVALYLGRVCPEKGLKTLVEAFQQVLFKRTDVVLHIYGNERACDGTAGFMQQLIDQTSHLVNRHIFFHEPVANVVPILQAADLLILPSEWGEPFGRVLIEAMACGTPVIGTDCGGIPEVLSPEFSDHLVPSHNADLLAAKIESLMDWRQLQPDLAQRCRRLVKEKFSRERLLQDMLTLFQTAVDSRH